MSGKGNRQGMLMARLPGSLRAGEVLAPWPLAVPLRRLRRLSILSPADSSRQTGLSHRPPQVRRLRAGSPHRNGLSRPRQPCVAGKAVALGASRRDLPLVAAYAVEPGYCQDRFPAQGRYRWRTRTGGRARRAGRGRKRRPTLGLDAAGGFLVHPRRGGRSCRDPDRRPSVQEVNRCGTCWPSPRQPS